MGLFCSHRCGPQVGYFGLHLGTRPPGLPSPCLPPPRPVPAHPSMLQPHGSCVTWPHLQVTSCRKPPCWSTCHFLLTCTFAGPFSPPPLSEPTGCWAPAPSVEPGVEEGLGKTRGSRQGCRKARRAQQAGLGPEEGGAGARRVRPQGLPGDPGTHKGPRGLLNTLPSWHRWHQLLSPCHPPGSKSPPCPRASDPGGKLRIKTKGFWNQRPERWDPPILSPSRSPQDSLPPADKQPGPRPSWGFPGLERSGGD